MKMPSKSGNLQNRTVWSGGSPTNKHFILYCCCCWNCALHHEIWRKSLLDLSYFSDFLTKKFLNHDKSPKRPKFHFETTATDTHLVSKVVTSVQNIVIDMILKEEGLLNWQVSSHLILLFLLLEERAQTGWLVRDVLQIDDRIEAALCSAESISLNFVMASTARIFPFRAFMIKKESFRSWVEFTLSRFNIHPWLTYSNSF